MKKILLVVLAVSLSFSGYSQKGKVTAALNFIETGELDKAKSALDEAMVNEKSKNLPNTFFAKGQLCQAVFDSNDSKYASYYADPLEEAYNAYEKALSLDTKSAIKKKMITGMVYNNLLYSLGNKGIQQFQQSDFANAVKTFETQIKVMESDCYVGGIDTGVYYNAGLAALNAKDYTNGQKFFQKCIDLGYLGVTPHFQLAECYTGLGQADKAEQYLLSLPGKYPNDPSITLSLIDAFIKSGKYDQASKYLEQAIADDPSNYNLYYVAGVTYLNNSNFDKAIDYLTKANQLNGNVFDTNYGLGAAYINYGADLSLKANDIIDIAEYNAAVTKANEEFKKAIPYMEAARKLQPDNIDVLNSLKELYFRLRQEDPSLTAKYNEVNGILESLR